MKIAVLPILVAMATTPVYAREYHFALYSESACGGTEVKVSGEFPATSNSTGCIPIPDVPDDFQLGSMSWSSGLGCVLNVKADDSCNGNWWTSGPQLEGWIWPDADQCIDPWFDNYNTTPDKWPKVKYYDFYC